MTMSRVWRQRGLRRKRRSGRISKKTLHAERRLPFTQGDCISWGYASGEVRLPARLMDFAKRILRAVAAALVVGGLAATPAAAIELPALFKGKQQLSARPIPVDAAAAARMLSDYRRKHGLGPVKLDPTLTRIAADHALKMAEANKVSHVVRGEGSFARRLQVGGYDAAVASENVGGGYFSLDEAFAGWRKSKPHNKNMLKPDVTVMGIARADAAGSKYGSYWSLVLARPYERPQGGPTGPATLPGGLIIGR